MSDHPFRAAELGSSRYGLAASVLFALTALGTGTVAAQVGAAQGGAGGPPPVAQLYAENCAGCHGAGAEGGGRAPALFDRRLLSARSDDQLHRTIRQGVPQAGMPAFADLLADADSWRLVAYMRTQGAALGPKPVFVPDPHGQVVQSGAQRVRVEVVARGLDTPWGLAFLPDGRMLITERSGQMRIVQGGKLLPDAVRGTPEVWVRQDSGLLDVAAHPDHARNGWIYLSYTDVAPGHSVDSPPPRQTRGRQAPRR